MMKMNQVVPVFLFIVSVSQAAHADSRASAQRTEPVAVEKKEQARPGNCLTPEEAELALLINKMRQDKQLPAVPVKPALYSVAKWHVIDLAVNAPHKDKTDERGEPCNLHSWSDRGKDLGEWKPLCYTANHRQALGMWQKPREISRHSSNGYEIIYWTSAPLSPTMPAAYWQDSAGESDMILQKGLWTTHPWKSMGVGIYGNYAAVWFSEKTTSEDEMKKCE